MVSDCKTFALKGWKLAAQKKNYFFGDFCLTSRIFLVSVLLSALVERFFVSRMRDFFVSYNLVQPNCQTCRQDDYIYCSICSPAFACLETLDYYNEQLNVMPWDTGYYLMHKRQTDYDDIKSLYIIIICLLFLYLILTCILGHEYLHFTLIYWTPTLWGC